jgi:hypothetical protein
MRRILPLVASVLFLLCTIAVHPQTTCTSVKKIEDCPDAGCGGWDRQLNIKKNYTSDPKKQTPVNRSLEEIKVMKYPEQWFSGKDRGELETLGEGQLVRVEAYLVGVRYDDATSANCKLGDSQAISHRLLLVSEDALGLKLPGRELSSVTALITPRVRRQHAKLGSTKNGQKAWITNWTKWKLDSLIYAAPRTGLLVRVTGLLLLDTEHIYNSIPRSTDWEIHPVLEIDVCRKKDRCASGAGWEKLESMNITEPHPPRPIAVEPPPPLIPYY